ncbi:hypothetical protein Hanom_Chr09g00860091 [Helianthus anomalus]
MSAENPETDVTMEFDMLVNLIWFPFRVCVNDGSTEFFRVEKLVVMEIEEVGYV